MAEENRHGDLMNKYSYLSGRVNMKAVEVTIQVGGEGLWLAWWGACEWAGGRVGGFS